MVLRKIGGGYDDVQDSEPSDPKIGDTWLDTSEDPPISKIYADVGDGDEWVTLPMLEQSDILSDGESFDGGNIDAKISEAGGVDWSDKSPEYEQGYVENEFEDGFTVSGSGYLISVGFHTRGTGATDGRLEVDGDEMFSDGVSVLGGVSTSEAQSLSQTMLYRFEDSFTLGMGENDQEGMDIGAFYVLD